LKTQEEEKLTAGSRRTKSVDSGQFRQREGSPSLTNQNQKPVPELSVWSSLMGR